jgi:hypothetical protein
MGIKHAFSSAKPVGADATKVRSSNWNADHVIDGDVDFASFNALFGDVSVHYEDVEGVSSLVVENAATRLFSAGGDATFASLSIGPEGDVASFSINVLIGDVNDFNSKNDGGTEFAAKNFDGSAFTPLNFSGQEVSFDVLTGERALLLSGVADAVNHLAITNAATGGNPTLSSAGDDADVGLEFATQGEGVYRFNENADGRVTIEFADKGEFQGGDDTIAWEAYDGWSLQFKTQGPQDIEFATADVTALVIKGDFVDVASPSVDTPSGMYLELSRRFSVPDPADDPSATHECFDFHLRGYGTAPQPGQVFYVFNLPADGETDDDCGLIIRREDAEDQKVEFQLDSNDGSIELGLTHGDGGKVSLAVNNGNEGQLSFEIEGESPPSTNPFYISVAHAGDIIFGTNDDDRWAIDGDDGSLIAQGPQFIQMNAMTPPANAPASAGRWFFQDNGGKVELCVIFPTGAAQVLAAEL